MGAEKRECSADKLVRCSGKIKHMSVKRVIFMEG